MDVFSYLLGKSSSGGGGGGGDISEYFASTINNSNYGGWKETVKKIPAMTIDGTSCYYMFSECGAYDIDISLFDTSNVTDTTGMFSNCYNLVNLDLSSFNTAKVNYMDSMFSGCSSLENLNLSNFTQQRLYTVYNMFDNCVSLEFLDIRNMEFSSFNYTDLIKDIPTSCEIIVKNDTEKTWFNTNFPSHTNVKTVAEYEA